MATGELEILFDRGFRKGDRPSQGEFVDRATPLLLGFVQGRLRVRGADVEEIAAEAIEKAVANAGGIDPGRPLLPYLYAVARNAFLDRCRRAAVRGGGGGGEGAISRPHGAAGGAGEGEAPSQEPWRRLNAVQVLGEFVDCARARLEGTLRSSLEAFLRNHWDNGLAAEDLRIPRETVAVHKSRIREKARPCFERFEGEF